MYDRILIPLDGSELAECVLPHVKKIARDCKVKEVILLRVCDTPSIPADYPANMPVSWEEHVDQLTAHSQQQCSLYLGDMEKQLKESGITVKADSCLGNAANEIVDYAVKNNVDLIIMSSHGRSGFARWAYGSVADRVFRATCVPILMVRAPGCKTGV